MLKRHLPLTLALLLVSGALGYYYFRTETAAPAPQFDTVRVDKGPIVARITATGTLSPLVTVQVGTQVSGTIHEIGVDFNSVVKKGKVLARLDPRLFQAALEQARANTVAARGNLEKAVVQAGEADRQYQRSLTLIKKSLVSQADLDTAKANADAAKAQVSAMKGSLAQAQAAMLQAQVNLNNATIVSPINGVVISRNVDVGQTVAASLQAPTLFTIAENLRRMQVDTNVAEADVGKVSVNMPAVFTVDAYPSEKFTGRVRQIRNAPQVVQNVVTYDAVIDVANPQLKLKPGMTANVSFIQAERENALRLPNAALRFRPPPDLLTQGTPQAAAGVSSAQGATLAATGGSSGGNGRGTKGRGQSQPPKDLRTVWVLRNGHPMPVPVRIGITDGSRTEVLKGDLREGDAVITDVGAGNQGSRFPSMFGRRPR